MGEEHIEEPTEVLVEECWAGAAVVEYSRGELNGVGRSGMRLNTSPALLTDSCSAEEWAGEQLIEGDADVDRDKAKEEEDHRENDFIRLLLGVWNDMSFIE